MNPCLQLFNRQDMYRATWWWVHTPRWYNYTFSFNIHYLYSYWYAFVNFITTKIVDLLVFARFHICWNILLWLLLKHNIFTVDYVRQDLGTHIALTEVIYHKGDSETDSDYNFRTLGVGSYQDCYDICLNRNGGGNCFSFRYTFKWYLA